MPELPVQLWLWLALTHRQRNCVEGARNQRLALAQVLPPMQHLTCWRPQMRMPVAIVRRGVWREPQVV